MHPIVPMAIITLVLSAALNSGATLFQLGLVPGWTADLVLVAMALGAVVFLERVRPKRGAAARAGDTVNYRAGE